MHIGAEVLESVILAFVHFWHTVIYCRVILATVILTPFILAHVILPSAYSGTIIPLCRFFIPDSWRKSFGCSYFDTSHFSPGCFRADIFTVINVDACHFSDSL